MFHVGKKHQLLVHFGIPYGHVFLETAKPHGVMNLKDGISLLADMCEARMISPEEALEMEGAMRAGGIFQTQRELVEQAGKAEVPAGFEPSYQFVLHTDCGLNITHGQIESKDGGHYDTVYNLYDGLFLLNDVVLKQGLHLLDAVHLFLQMKAADLPATKEEGQERYNALPPEQQLRSQTRSKTIEGPFGTMEVHVIEIGGLFGQLFGSERPQRSQPRR